MRRGIVTFLVLLSFVPTAMYAIDTYEREIGGVRQTRQFFLEQQAITVKEQDIEESFWRVAEYSAKKNSKVLQSDLDEWKKQMTDVEIWYGDTGGQDYPELLDEKVGNFKPVIKTPWPKGEISVQGKYHDGIIARISVGGTKGIFLIPMGAQHEYT